MLNPMDASVLLFETHAGRLTTPDGEWQFAIKEPRPPLDRQSRRPPCRCGRNQCASRACVRGCVGHWLARARVSHGVGRSRMAVRCAPHGRRRVSFVRSCASRACQYDRRSGCVTRRGCASARRCGPEYIDRRSPSHFTGCVHCRVRRTLLQVGWCSRVGVGTYRDDSGLCLRPQPRARDRLEPRTSAPAFRESSRHRAEELRAGRAISRDVAGARTSYGRWSRRCRPAARLFRPGASRA
jgi:hypothetical protein